MSLQRKLTDHFLDGHPQEAARVLDGLPPDVAAALLTECTEETGSRLLAHMLPPTAGAALAAMEAERAVSLVGRLRVDIATAILRQAPPPVGERCLSSLPSKSGRQIGSLLRAREGTAGALLDPSALALPEEHTVRQAMESIRKSPAHGRYNLYVVDTDRVLVGVLNLHELILAKPDHRLADVCKRTVHRLTIDADRRSIVEHAGWSEVHSLPVVDRAGVFVGVIRYRAMRRIEAELRGGRLAGAPTVEALGSLFGTGMAGLFGAMADAIAQNRQPQE